MKLLKSKYWQNSIEIKILNDKWSSKIYQNETCDHKTHKVIARKKNTNENQVKEYQSKLWFWHIQKDKFLCILSCVVTVILNIHYIILINLSLSLSKWSEIISKFVRYEMYSDGDWLLVWKFHTVTIWNVTIWNIIKILLYRR